jgi:hypothetical protein
MATSLSPSGTGVQDLIGTLRHRNDTDPGSRTRDMRKTGSADARSDRIAQGKKLAAAHHDFCVQILNVAALLSTQDSKPQTPNVKRRRQEGTEDVQSRRSRTGRSSVHRLAR